MSVYTTELRYLIEKDYPLGLNDYPIFDEAHRKTLNQKILEHYKFREIGFETPALFVDRLNTRMNEIMPFYNQLYKSELLKFEPIANYSFDETLTRDNNNSATFSNTSTANSTNKTTGNVTATSTKTVGVTGVDTRKITESENLLDVFSDTPQNLLSVPDIIGNLYATNVHRHKNDKTTEDILNTKEDTIDNTNESSDTISNGESDTTGTDRGNSSETKLENVIRHLTGFNNVSGSSLLEEFRRTLLNIDLMIIDELSDLFMNVW